MPNNVQPDLETRYTFRKAAGFAGYEIVERNRGQNEARAVIEVRPGVFGIDRTVYQNFYKNRTVFQFLSAFVEILNETDRNGIHPREVKPRFEPEVMKRMVDNGYAYDSPYDTSDGPALSPIFEEPALPAEQKDAMINLFNLMRDSWSYSNTQARANSNGETASKLTVQFSNQVDQEKPLLVMVPLITNKPQNMRPDVLSLSKVVRCMDIALDKIAWSDALKASTSMQGLPCTGFDFRDMMEQSPKDQPAKQNTKKRGGQKPQ